MMWDSPATALRDAPGGYLSTLRAWLVGNRACTSVDSTQAMPSAHLACECAYCSPSSVLSLHGNSCITSHTQVHRHRHTCTHTCAHTHTHTHTAFRDLQPCLAPPLADAAASLRHRLWHSLAGCQLPSYVTVPAQGQVHG